MFTGVPRTQENECLEGSGGGFRVRFWEDSGLGLRFQDSGGFRIQESSGFWVQSSGFRVQGSGFKVQSLGCMVQGAEFRGFRVLGSQNFGFRGLGLGSPPGSQAAPTRPAPPASPPPRGRRNCTGGRNFPPEGRKQTRRRAGRRKWSPGGRNSRFRSQTGGRGRVGLEPFWALEPFRRGLLLGGPGGPAEGLGVRIFQKELYDQSVGFML